MVLKKMIYCSKESNKFEILRKFRLETNRETENFYPFFLDLIIDLLVTQPDDITFSTGSKVQNGGRWRYQYTVSWKVRNTLLKSMIYTVVCWKV